MVGFGLKISQPLPATDSFSLGSQKTVHVAGRYAAPDERRGGTGGEESLESLLAKESWCYCESVYTCISVHVR